MRAPEGRVKEEITPRGDGKGCSISSKKVKMLVKEEITPRGDGKMKKVWVLERFVKLRKR